MRWTQRRFPLVVRPATVAALPRHVAHAAASQRARAHRSPHRSAWPADGTAAPLRTKSLRRQRRPPFSSSVLVDPSISAGDEQAVSFKPCCAGTHAGHCAILYFNGYPRSASIPVRPPRMVVVRTQRVGEQGRILRHPGRARANCQIQRPDPSRTPPAAFFVYGRGAGTTAHLWTAQNAEDVAVGRPDSDLC